MAQLVLIVVLAGLLSRRTMSIPVLVALGVIAAGIVFMVIGNFQVADSIWRTRGDPGFGDGYAQGHERAATGDLLVVIGGGAVALAAGLARRPIENPLNRGRSRCERPEVSVKVS